MTNQLTIYDDPAIPTGQETDPIASVIQAWLYTKARRSGSRRTEEHYRAAIDALRRLLQQRGLDLDSDPRAVALGAQAWAAHTTKADHPLAASTYNQRLACLSSFYVYAKKQGFFTGENPIARIERRPVQGYAHAAAYDIQYLRHRLNAIDRRTLAGQRDYLLLHIALNTGRRLSELAALRWADLQFTSQQVTVTWQHAKGGKVMNDRLPQKITTALLDYLHAVYGADLASLAPDAPIWISLSPRNRGQAIGIQTIADICDKHLGMGKVHALRHTFARMMEDAGAKVSDIQSRLGHESLATTGRYLAALRRAENPFADDLLDQLWSD